MNLSSLISWCEERAAINRRVVSANPPIRGYAQEAARLTDEAEKLEAIAGYLRQLPEPQPQPEIPA